MTIEDGLAWDTMPGDTLVMGYRPVCSDLEGAPSGRVSGRNCLSCRLRAMAVGRRESARSKLRGCTVWCPRLPTDWPSAWVNPRIHGSAHTLLVPGAHNQGGGRIQSCPQARAVTSRPSRPVGVRRWHPPSRPNPFRDRATTLRGAAPFWCGTGLGTQTIQ